ncbi:hypothetical protein ACF8C1_19340 [Pseudomonas sp. zjy_9]
MGMFDRDWYREERRQQRQQQSSNFQPQPETVQRVGPPALTTAPAILAILAAIAAGVIILGFA